MKPDEKFRTEVKQNIEGLGRDLELQSLSRIWVRDGMRHKWAYNFTWLGRPAIQFPNDAWALQELIWAIQPDLIIETGIAHGGSLVFSASMLALLDMTDGIKLGGIFDPRKSKRKVLGIDIDIRKHNREAIEAHPMASRIQMIEGSSVSSQIIKQVETIAKDYEKILICLDSNHTHDHVLAELNAYAALTSIGSYCVVFDTLVDEMPKEMFFDRPWGPNNNPKTAVLEFLKTHPEFEIDKSIDHKLLISVAPDGYLKRINL
jgi:cephalosporin hydroxylase